MNVSVGVCAVRVCERSACTYVCGACACVWLIVFSKSCDFGMLVGIRYYFFCPNLLLLSFWRETPRRAWKWARLGRKLLCTARRRTTCAALCTARRRNNTQPPSLLSLPLSLPLFSLALSTTSWDNRNCIRQSCHGQKECHPTSFHEALLCKSQQPSLQLQLTCRSSLTPLYVTHSRLCSNLSTCIAVHSLI